ncbi:hypothetical protein [Corynebacterium sp. ACRQP]|uniref:hypothetical protein n=1 Tax=Corynebacterium sp. ACRQP TaxID=2918195 RepID=UPI001EF6107B|nr:hypothetical protein [Corynebacterium sp. ACRQP]MCG7236011.1 hypothetical protein [Corynebacterium sp. ACRQP]
MSYYFSHRAFEEQFGDLSPLVRESQNNTSSSLSLKPKLRKSIPTDFSSTSSKTDIVKTQYDAVDFSSVRKIAQLKDQKAKRLSQARAGELVVIPKARITASAFPILQVPDEVLKGFHRDIGSNSQQFYVFGGVVKIPATLRVFHYTGPRVYLLGSIDNLTARKRLIPASREWPNSYPSSASNARYLINGLYDLQPGRREAKRLPSDEQALNEFAGMIGRTVTGEGFSNTPRPENCALYESTKRIIGTVTMRSESALLIRPIVIE